MNHALTLGKKAFTWTVVLLTIAWSMSLSALIPAGIVHGVDTVAPEDVEAGDLITLDKEGFNAVYYVTGDMERMYFVNGMVFDTWALSFDDVKSLPGDTDLDLFFPPANPGAVAPRSASLLVKSTASPSVYALGCGNMRHKLADETAAMTLFGEAWAGQIIDLPDFVISLWEMGDELDGTAPVCGQLLENEEGTVYHVNEDGTFSMVDGDVDAALEGFVLGGDDAAAWIADAEMGGDVTPAETVADPSQMGASDDSGDEGEEEEDTTPTGEVTLSLSANTPGSATFPKGAFNVPALEFIVSAGPEAVELDELTIKRSGAGATTGLTGYVYQGGERLTSGKTFSSDENTATFGSLDRTVAANSSMTFELRLGVASTAGAGQHVFSVTEASGVGNIDVSGLPVSGNAIDVSSAVTAGTVAITKNGSLPAPVLGDSGVSVTKFQLETTNEDGWLHSVTLRNGGTIDIDDLSNYTFWVGSTELAVTYAVTNNRVTLMLDTPYKLTDGDGKIFTVKADISSDADVAETIIFYVDKQADVHVVGGKFASKDYGLTPSIGSFDATGDGHTLVIQGGGVTISNKTDAAHDVKTGENAVEFMEVEVKATDDEITVEQMILEVAVQTPQTSGGVGYGTYSDANNDSTFDDGDVAMLTNIKIKDADTGKTVGSAKGITDATGWDAGTFAASTTLSFTYDDTFSINKGETRTLQVVADIHDNQVSGVVYAPTLKFDTTSFVVKDSQDNTVTDIVPATDIAGENLTTRTAGLTVTRAASPESRTIVAGATVDTLGIIMAAAAGAGNDVSVTALTLDAYVGSTSTATFAEGVSGTVDANELVQSVALYHGGELIAGPVSVNTSGDAIFDSGDFVGGSFTIPAGTNKTVVVEAITNGNAPYGGNDDHFSFTLQSADITAEDDDGSTVSATVSPTDLNGTTSPSVIISVTGSGTITVAQDSGTPDSQILLAGASAEQEVLRLKLDTTKEAYTVEELTPQVAAAGAYDTISYMQLYDANDVQVGPDGGVSIDSNGKANFTGLSINVPVSEEVVVKVKAKIKVIGERTLPATSTAGTDSDSGDILQVNLSTTSGDFRAVGQASGEVDEAADTTNGNSMTVRKTKATVDVLALSTTALASAERTVMKFTVTADANGDVVFGGLSPQFTLIDAGGSSTLTMSTGTLYLYHIGASGDQLLNASGANGTVTTGNDGQIDIDVDTGEVVTITAGQTETFEIRATFSGVETSDSVEVKLIQDAAALSAGTETFANAIADANDDFIWSDKGADTSDVTSVEWINSFQFLNWDNTISALSKTS